MKHYRKHIAWLVYVLFITSGALLHEFWSDEAHHYLLAHKSGSFIDLWKNAQYEGHPLLFDTLVWISDKLYPTPYWMVFYNLLFAALAAWMLLFKSPFRFTHTVLLLSGYFFLFEYAVVSRNYSILLFFFFTALHLFSARKKMFLFYLCLLAMVLSHFMGLFLAGAILLFAFLKGGEEKQFIAGRTPYFVLALFILTSGLLVFMHRPPANHFLFQYHANETFFKSLGKGFSASLKSLFPVPDFTSPYPWNKNLLAERGNSVSVLFSVFCFVLPALIFVKNRKALITYFVFAFLFSASLMYSPLIVANRHCGIIFAGLLGIIWMANPQELFQQNKWAMRTLVFIGFIHTLSGVFLVCKDLLNPFSAAKETVAYIKTHKLSTLPIIATHHSAGPPLVLYLGTDVWYPERNAYGSFCNWSKEDFFIEDKKQLASRFENFFLQQQKDSALLIINSFYVENLLDSAAEKSLKGNFRLQHIENFENSMVNSERYKLYFILRNKQ